ncbi:tripartite tricarboxylate transporter TctB family protein [Azospirillum sp. SYSU D00513]|uniref:tripartite tricarboxylate transporter TctB family protein n=1 Tax=Azospirillum sp. SYSU D00513 TaxID=2812561 RepID=UPI001A957303
MTSLSRNPKDLLAGVLYLAFGLAGVWIARDYSMGTSSRMGAGYFPTVLGGMLILFGLLSVIRSFLVPGEAVGTVAWKGLALVVGATALFGVLLEPAGLVVSLLVLILLSASASRMFRFEWRAAVALVALVAFCVFVFVRGLGVPMPLFGSWFGG